MSKSEGMTLAEMYDEVRDERDTLRAKVAELEGRESGPKPITDEAFPKDEQVLLGHYDERENMWLWVSSGHFDPEAEKWFCDWSDDYFPPVGHQGITHWMPLPTPPTEDKPGQVLPEWQGAGEYLEGKGDA